LRFPLFSDAASSFFFDDHASHSDAFFSRAPLKLPRTLQFSLSWRLDILPRHFFGFMPRVVTFIDLSAPGHARYARLLPLMPPVADIDDYWRQKAFTCRVRCPPPGIFAGLRFLSPSCRPDFSLIAIARLRLFSLMPPADIIYCIARRLTDSRDADIFARRRQPFLLIF